MKMSNCVNDGMTELQCDDDSNTCAPFLKGSVDITIEEQREDGTANMRENTRYVRVCGSNEDCRTYPVSIDSATGFGQLHIDEVQSVQSVVVLVDDQDMQIVNGDDYEVTYYVNEEKVEEDYATVILSNEGNEHASVHIVNRELQRATLEIYKVLRDEFGNSLTLDDSMCFILCLDGMGMHEEVILDAGNDFQVFLNDILPGEYLVKEQCVSGYHTYYSFNGSDEMEMCSIYVEQGHNELQMINQRNSQSLLTIEKLIRDRNGELIKPQDDECFEVRIIARNYDERIVLNCENDFAVDLEGLEPGYYDVNEVSEDCYETSYLVNGERESGHAHVEIRPCESSNVMIINTPIMDNCSDSPLRICKYVRGSDGCLHKPDEEDSFKVMLCGCGIYQTFNLNVCNNFCVDIEHICCGEYEIKEIDNCEYNTSYIVNDGCERTSAFVCIHECDTNCVTVINEERNKGSVCVCKYIKDSYGNYVKPQPGECFVATLRSFCFYETFVLDENNDWCMYFENLREGSYDVRERNVEEYETSYIVNGCKEQRHGRFIIDDDCTNEVRIINTPRKEECGLLKINKFIEKCNGELVKPDSDEVFEVMVTGSCFKECYRLHSKNNWCVVLEGLENGEYEIAECDNEYDVSYIVNGCDEANAMVCMGYENQEVTIVNRERRGGTMRISSLIRNCDQDLERPRNSASFEVLIEGNNETRCYTLDSRNRFSILLDDMKDGMYRITQKDTYGYEVTYEINGEEGARGRVLMEGQDVNVNIINAMTNCQGMLTITKYIVDEDGKKLMPCPQDCFHLTLKSPYYQKDITLDHYNDFCVFFDDLREGNYVLSEDCSDYDVEYIIDGCLVEDGRFTLGRDDVQIEVLNKEKAQPVLCIQKRIRKDGRLVMPDPCDEYEFVLKGNDVHEVYQLNEDNDWTICLCEVRNQHYEVKELHVCGNVSYLIDECLQSDGYFLFEGCDMTVTIINEDPCDDNVRICKCIEENGKQCKPYRWETFEVMIEGRNFKQCYTLNCDNDWCIDLDDLKPGNYEIKELGDYDNSFVINECMSENGCFFVGQGDVDIVIINHLCKKGSMKICAYNECRDERKQPDDEDVYRFMIQSECDKKTYTLDCENDWCLCFDDLKFGEYLITSKDPEVRFDVNGDIMKKAHFMLDDNFMNIALLKDCCEDKYELHICKMMKDECGSESKPVCGEFDVRVTTPDGKDDYTLGEFNNWHLIISDVSEGMVTVEELGIDNVRYRVNDGPLKSKAKFRICEDSEVIVLNPQVTCGDLNIIARIEDCDGKMRTPDSGESFEACLISDDSNDKFVLNKRNRWKKEWCELPSGNYVVSIEDYGYDDVTFYVNGEEIANPEFTMGEEDVVFTIVFHPSCNNGILEILKYKKDDSCGCFVRPCMDETYDIRVSGPAFDETITLDEDNHWRYRFNHLASGMYEVEEVSGTDKVTYIVNGGSEMDRGMVEIEDGSSYVKVINQPYPQDMGAIEVCKFIQDEGGLRRPDSDDEFAMVIKSKIETKRFILNDANDFCLTIEGLDTGRYEIMEEQPSGKVTYIVNDGKPSMKAVINVNKEMNTVKVLNEDMNHAGSMTITKFIRSDDKLEMPSSDMSYRIHISRPGFNKVITLNSGNDFQMTLTNLANGWYVIDELDHDNVSYRIDGGSEVDCGVVRVQNDEHDVWVINEGEDTNGSITLTKYIRQDHQLVKPNPTDSFRFHISRAGFNEIYTLDQSNDWTMMITNLENGLYVIQELDETYDVTYIINGGSEANNGVVDVQDDANSVFIINTPTEEGGSIHLEKFIRQSDGSLTRPTGDFSVQVHISRPGFNNFYTLNSGNDWSLQLNNLENGLYVIDEMDTTNKVTYIINGGSEVSNGIVDVQDNVNRVEMINELSPSQSGSIAITKYVKSSDGTLNRPDAGFTARVHVSRPGYNEFFTLNQANNWSITINDLMPGLYVISEPDYDDRVTYIINGGTEVNSGVVDVRNNANQVQMINHLEPQQNVLRINKFIRNEAGQLVPPADDEVFRVQLLSAGTTRNILLDRNNNWSTELRNLANGQYQILESDSGYDVVYIVNDEPESSEANIVLNDDEQSVKIINQMSSNNNRLELRKYIKDNNGGLIKPDPSESFEVSVNGNDYFETFTLNSDNDFSTTITDLAPGTFVIQETSGQNYTITYRINGGQEVDSAEVVMERGATNIVEVINTNPADTNTLEVYKYILDDNGNFIKPNTNEVFTIRIAGSGINETYTMNEANRWQLITQDLPDGSYTIREESSLGYKVQYIVNGGNLQDNASFEVRPNAMNIIEIVNSKDITNEGSIHMSKRIRDNAGNLVVPQNGESFEIRLCSMQGYTNIFTLNAANAYTQHVAGLSNGIYYLEELGYEPYDVTFIINGGQESANSRMEVSGTAQQNVMIINTSSTAFYQAKGNNSFKIVLE